MAAWIKTLFVFVFMLEASGLHASFETPHSRQLLRFKNQCESQGLGKSCYIYARLLWSEPKASDRAQARRYLLRSCELKYKSACQAYESRAYLPTLKKRGATNANHCFKTSDLKSVRLTQAPRGQVVTILKPNSFWTRVGFQDGDLWVKANGLTVNSPAEIEKAFRNARMQSVFQIERGNIATTLIYTCR